MTPAGFPHSDTCGSMLSRQLPAAFRSLTRPSSAPDAKASTVSPYSLDYRCSRSLSSSQGARRLAPSKLNSVSRADDQPGAPRPPNECRRQRVAKWLLRKEVIQPHLPVRLPCYDFTPIANPTFDGSLHKGWATGFGCCPLSWCDGRCVQGPGTYSPQHC